MAELHDLTALEQVTALRGGELSPVDLVEHYLYRVERLDAAVGAFVTVTAERAGAAARAAERRLTEARRRDDVAGLPLLLGVPTAIKDLHQTAGLRTTFGSAAMADFVPEVSDEVVLRLAAAGTVSLGKTSTPEFGSPCYTEPDVAPPARTPWDLSRMAGGSSGGAGAAVSAGLVPLAQGSDGGGSIRIPASCCGLYGLKPTRGRISPGPVYADPVGLGTSGPLSHSVRDAAAMLDAMAGPAVGDPYWAPPLPDGASFLACCDREPGRLRVARFATPLIADAAVHQEVLDGYGAATTLLEALGHDVEEVDVPLPPEAVAAFETCWSVLSALAPVPPGSQHLLRPLTRWLQGRGSAVGAPEFGLAVADLRRYAAGLLRHLAPYDAVLSPTLAQPPLPIGEIRDDADPARDFENQKRFTPFTAVWNLTGMPAASLPLHQTSAGLPVGVMLASRPAREDVLLSLSAQLEAAAPWRGRVPPCW
jgi:amidase